MILALLVAFPLIYWYSQWFLPWAEVRPELVEIPDPLLPYFPRFDASWPINILHYSAIGVFVWFYPDHDWNRLLWTYSCLLLYRSLVLFLHPFKVHHEVVPLVDHILMYLLRIKPENNLLNDLSFSGHLSLYGMLAIIHPSFIQFYVCIGVLVSLLMFCGRIHYVADVIIAPAFSVISYHSSFFVEAWMTCLASGVMALVPSIGPINSLNIELVL
jgi:hypothetical protein